ncbi:MAG: hypothetical protein ACOCOB_04420, partial [Prevotella sp.]
PFLYSTRLQQPLADQKREKRETPDFVLQKNDRPGLTEKYPTWKNFSLFQPANKVFFYRYS